MYDEPMGRIGPNQLHTNNTHLFCVSKRFGENSQSFDKELMGTLGTFLVS